MPDITNPALIRASNTMVRPAADALARAYAACKTMAISADDLAWDQAFPADSSQLADGSPADGRPGITANDVRALVAAARAFVALMEAASNAHRQAVLRAAVNPSA